MNLHFKTLFHNCVSYYINTSNKMMRKISSFDHKLARAFTDIVPDHTVAHGSAWVVTLNTYEHICFVSLFMHYIIADILLLKLLCGIGDLKVNPQINLFLVLRNNNFCYCSSL